MVQVVNVDVRRLLHSNVTARTERAMAGGVGVPVVVVCFVRLAHMLRLVMRHGSYGNPTLVVWVAKGDYGMVSRASGSGVSRLVNGDYVRMALGVL